MPEIAVAGAGMPAAFAAPTDHDHDHDYGVLLEAVRASFGGATAEGEVLFLTDAEGLFDLYLDALPAERQLHNCHACRRFLERFGGLVVIDEDGDTVPAMWGCADAPPFYRPVFAALGERVRKARVVAPFRCREATWGTPVTGAWTHLAVTPPPALVHRERSLTAGQAMAAAKEGFRTVAAALADFGVPALDEALRVLEADALSRSERFLGPARWLRALHDRPRGRRGENLLWLAVATAPEGFLHPRASVVGSLLEDIAAGMPFDAVKARFDAKLHPLRYQRPQAAPSAGSIKAAEDLFAKLGLEPALHRRFARLEEVPLVWSPRPAEEPGTKGGVFGHLTPKGAEPARRLDLPARTVTWEKFARTVLPTAERIRLVVPHHGRFIALTTAERADAPPILKWDREDERNPLAWYVYPSGSPAAQWGLPGGAAVEVTGVALFPNATGTRPMVELSDGVILLLRGAADTRHGGNALFPECLKAELHGVRSVIEAYSRSATLGGREQATACGYDIRKSAADAHLRVLAGGAWDDYRIDRWD